MTDQGKANYEGYRKESGGVSLVSGQPIPGWDDMPRDIRRAWDAGACAVELWLAEAPVDEDMPGNEVDRVKTDAQVKLDAHRDEIDRLRAALRHIRDSEHYAGGEAETLRRLQHLAGATLGGPQPDHRALLARAVRELAGSGMADVAAELARDGGIEL